MTFINNDDQRMRKNEYLTKELLFNKVVFFVSNFPIFPHSTTTYNKKQTNYNITIDYNPYS
jgi:hypothetical protein